MSYPQQYQPQGFPAQQAPQQYADPNAAQQFAPPQGYVQPPQFQAPPQQYAPQPGYPQAPMPGQPQYGAPQQQAYQPAVEEDVENTESMFGGAPSISWDVAKGYVLGTPRGGLVISKKVTQQTDAESKLPKFYQGSNKPMQQIVVTVQTRERTDPSDDGKRTLYVKGLGLKAAKAAFEPTGARDIEIGSYFYMANTAKNGGKNGKSNVFECVYARPGQPDPLGHMPAYVAPQAPAAPAPQQQQFVPPQQPNYPAPGQQQSWNPYGQQAPAAPAAQGNAYGYGHQPPQSPGGQAYAAQQPPAQPQQGYQSAQQVAQGPYAPQQPGQASTPYGLPPSAVAEHADQVQGGPPAGYNPFGG